jgi:GDP-L-fucose synthase
MRQSARIYVAGHNGLVGSALMRELTRHGYTDLLTASCSDLDLRNQQQVEDFFKKESPEYVFLAAAKVGGIGANNTYKAEFIYDNIMIAANVIHASYRHGIKKLINFGSSCIYPKHASQPLKEEYLLSGVLEPTNEPYAVAKIAAIKLCRYYNEQYGSNFISLMPTNLYGPYDNFNMETAHVLPALIRKFHLAKLLMNNDYEAIRFDIERYSLGFGVDIAKNNKDLCAMLNRVGISSKQVALWGSGSPYREFLHVDDVARAAVFLAKGYGYHDVGECINVGTGSDCSIQELAYMIKNIVGFEGDILFDTTKPDGTPKKLLDVTRIKALGWKPTTALFEGLQLIYDWYCQKAVIRSTKNVETIA